MLITLSTRQIKRMIRDFSVAPAGAEPNPFPPGVNDENVLVDPRAYYYWLINRTDGQPADDWVSVLTASGIPEGFQPWEVPYDNGFYGLTQQIGSGGVRGRLFLPTASPDDLGYYSHPIDLLAGEDPNLEWFYRDRNEGPPYCPIGTSGIPSPGPGPGGISREEVQMMIDEQCIKYESKIALLMNSGKIMGLMGGGPSKDDEVVTLLAKSEIHAWESLTIKKGE